MTEFQLELAREHARVAEQRQDWAEALERWQEVRTGWPEQWDGYGGAAEALRLLGREADAYALLDNATARFAADMRLWHDRARLAEQLQDWADAERCWRVFLTLDQQTWWAYGSLANNLLEQGRYADAEAVLSDALSRLGAVPELLSDLARHYERVGDWRRADTVWLALLADDASFWPAHAGHAKALTENGQAGASWEYLAGLQEQFLLEADYWHDRARLAERLRNWDDAERCWCAHLMITPMLPHVHFAWVDVLYNSGSGDEAQDAAVRVINKFRYDADSLADFMVFLCCPNRTVPVSEIDYLYQFIGEHSDRDGSSLNVARAAVLLARELKNWPDYRRRSSAASARFPEDLGLQIMQSEAVELFPDDADGSPESNRISPRALDDRRVDVGADTALFMAFESLGGGRGPGPYNGDEGGCEFGLAQRFYGTEPLSLLRWATIEFDNLIYGLNSAFDGIEMPEGFTLHEQGHYDWKVVVPKYGIEIDHTHLDRSKVSQAEAAKLVATRFKFLKRKLFEDLREGQRIFVYRVAAGPITIEKIDELVAALGRWGGRRLLFVVRENLSGKPCVIDAVNTAFVVARIDHRATPGETPKFSGWLDLCRQTLRYFQ